MTVRNGINYLEAGDMAASLKKSHRPTPTHQADPNGLKIVQPGAKPINPKDAIGIAKVPMSCVPMPVVAELALAMMEGALKYGRHNYRVIGVRSSVYFDATMRHLCAWWEGEDIDPESGLSHVTKAISSLAVLRDAQLQDCVTDDRPPRSAPFVPELNERAAELLARHPEPVPAYTELLLRQEAMMVNGIT